MINKKYNIFFAALIIAVLVMTTVNSFGQYGNKLLTLDPAVRTGKLPNGFTYFIRHNEEPKNRVILYLANKVGAILEDEDQQGLAHFLEHMNFNGTKHFPKNDLVDYLQKSGIRFGADINAYTGFDETVYQLPLPSDNLSVLNNGLQIMRDWAQETTLDPAEIDKERGVVLEEERLGQGAAERMRRKYFPLILNGSKYANRIPIGKVNILKSFKPETIQRFYKDWYRPNLQSIIVVGDIDVEQMEKKIKSMFSDLKNPSKSRPRTPYMVSLKGKNNFIAITDPEITSVRAEVLIKHKAPELKTIADYRNMIIITLYNQMLRNRFSELSRKKNVPFIQGGAEIGSFIGGLDSFSAGVTVRSGELEEGFKSVWREVIRAKRYGFVRSEFERAKLSLLNSMEQAFKEKDKTSSDQLVNEYLQYFLTQKAAIGISKEYEMVKQQLPDIGLTDFNQLSKAYITAANRDIIIMAPEIEKNDLPNDVLVNKWMDSVDQEDILPYREEQTKMSLINLEPVPGKIISKQIDTAINAVTYLLDNGVKVMLKPTKFKNDEIQFNAFSSGGTSLYSDEDYQSAANAAGIIAASGVGNYNADQLDRYLMGKQYWVQPYIAERFEGISGWSTNHELPEALKLVYAYFTAPRKDIDIFENMIQKSKAGLKNRLNDPNSVFSDTISAVLGNYSIRRTGPSIPKLDQIKLDKSYKIYKERFADASGFTFVFDGSIDTVGIQPFLEKYLGSLPSTFKEEKAKNLGIHIPGGRIERTIFKGLEDRATVKLVFSGTVDYSMLKKIELDAIKQILQIRLVERLREEEAGVYSPNIETLCVKYPSNRYSLTINFGCAPANVEKLIQSAMEEVHRLRKNGPSQKNVDKFIAEQQLQFETLLKSNGFWINYLSDQLQDDEPLKDIMGYKRMLKMIDPKTIQTAAEGVLNDRNFIRLVLKPENLKH